LDTCDAFGDLFYLDSKQTMGRQRKIGIVSEYFYPHLGGMTEHVYFLSRELAQLGFEVVIITGYAGASLPVSLPPGVRLINLAKSMTVFANGSIGKISYGLNLGKRVKKFLAEENFDLIHYQNALDPILPLLFLKYSSAVNISTFHTYYEHSPLMNLFRSIAQKYINKLDGRIAVSETCVKAMQQYIHGDFSVIGNGVDVSWFSKEHPGSAPSKDIFFLGRLDPRNGVGRLIQAFPFVLNQIPDARLIIAGDGPRRALYEKMAGAFLHEKIIFKGAVTHERPSLFSNSGVFCYPAEIASFGITILESMAAGVPVVAHDNSGFRELICPEENGVLVNTFEPKSLANGLVKVLKNSDFAQKLKHAGFKTAQKYSWPNIAREVLDFYDRIYQMKKGERFAH